jgi:SAM-dependent methyltransferase
MPRERYGALAVRTYSAFIDPLLLPLRPRIVHTCRTVEARSVLDIACATGAQCRALGRVGIRATGIDLSEDMIRAAQRIGGRNVRYLHGSAYELPLEDDSFDVSLLVLALHEHTEEERSAILAEAHRVLRPSGHLIVADFAEPNMPRLHLPWRVIRLIEATAGPEHHTGFLDYVSRGSLEGLAARYGLEVQAARSSHFGAIRIAVSRREG